MLEFDNITQGRFERIRAAAEKDGIALPADGNGASVAFHGVTGTSTYTRRPGDEGGTLFISVTHVPSLFGVQLVKPEEAEDRVRQFIETVK